MTPQTTGLIVGGVLAAFCYGIANLFTKASIQSGIGIGWYLVIIGAVTIMVGAVFFLIIPEQPINPRSATMAGLLGLFWGIGTGCVAIALSQYGTPLGKLTPLFNLNTLITVLLALWIFSEWRQVKIPQLLIGTLLIIAGSVFVARS